MKISKPPYFQDLYDDKLCEKRFFLSTMWCISLFVPIFILFFMANFSVILIVGNHFFKGIIRSSDQGPRYALNLTKICYLATNDNIYHIVLRYLSWFHQKYPKWWDIMLFIKWYRITKKCKFIDLKIFQGSSKVMGTFEFSHVLCYSWLPSWSVGFMPNFNQHSTNVSWGVIGQFAYLWALKHSNCEQTCLWMLWWPRKVFNDSASPI